MDSCVLGDDSFWNLYSYSATGEVVQYGVETAGPASVRPKMRLPTGVFISDFGRPDEAGVEPVIVGFETEITSLHLSRPVFPFLEGSS